MTPTIKWTLFTIIMLIMLFPAQAATILIISACIAIPYGLLTNLFGPNRSKDE